MKYYRIALIAPVEFCADNPVWRCFETLRLAGHAVELLDPRRYPGILNADGTPDLDALAPFIERFHPDIIAGAGEDATQILGQLEKSGAGCDEAPRRFVVFGYVGPNNFGDELIFSVIADQLERRFPGAHIQLIGHDPASALRRHGVASITCECKLEADIMLRGASALIYMAGIMFDDPFEWWSAGPVDPFLNPRSEIGGQAAFCTMASLYGVPQVFLGIGAGPLANPDARRLVALEARLGARYLPRDAETERLLLAAGVPASQIDRKADLAFLVDERAARGEAEGYLAEHGLNPGSYLAISLREHRTVPEGFEHEAAGAIAKICRAHRLKAAFIEFSPEDAGIHRRVADLLPQDVEAVHLDSYGPTGRTIDVIAQASAALAMRLHLSIVANACGVPSVGFDYNEKIRAFYVLMGRPHALVPMGADERLITDTFERMISDDDDLVRIEQGARSCRKLAGEAIDELVDIVETAHPEPLAPRMLYPRCVSIEEERLHAVKAERDTIAAERDAARAELDRVRASTTWRVGSAVTALPRALKRWRDRG